MKRVLVFSLAYYPRFVGGAEVAIKEITNRIPSEEIEFHMVTLRFDRTLPKTERIGNITVHRIGPVRENPSLADLKRFPLYFSKHLYQFLAVFEAAKLHRKYRFDGIWAMMAHSCAVPAGLFKLLHPKVAYLLTLQEGDPPEHIERLARPVWPLFKRGFTTADELQAISSFLLAWGKRMGFTGGGVVIPNAADLARFSKAFSEEEIARMKEALGKGANDVYLVTTSRLVRKNAVDDVIRALPLLPTHVSFVVYGIGPEEVPLKQLVAKLGLENRVRFMGEIGHDDMPLALAASDIFIRPSRSEGMGISFVEAMAAGLPVIATQEGGIVDFLFDEKRNPEQRTTGWAVDTDAPEDIARAVTEILQNPQKVARVTETARAMVRERYDWQHVAVSMRALFRRLLEVQ